MGHLGFVPVYTDRHTHRVHALRFVFTGVYNRIREATCSLLSRVPGASQAVLHSL